MSKTRRPDDSNSIPFLESGSLLEDRFSFDALPAYLFNNAHLSIS